MTPDEKSSAPSSPARDPEVEVLLLMRPVVIALSVLSVLWALNGFPGLRVGTPSDDAIYQIVTTLAWSSPIPAAIVWFACWIGGRGVRVGPGAWIWTAKMLIEGFFVLCVSFAVIYGLWF